jgi:DNA-binding beta-propeller fold protein YncE
VGDTVRIGGGAVVAGDTYSNELRVSSAALLGPKHHGVTLPVLALPAPPTVAGPGSDVTVPDGGSLTLPPGVYHAVRVGKGATLVLQPGAYDVDGLYLKGGGDIATTMSCATVGATCVVRIRTRAALGAERIGVNGGAIRIELAGGGTTVVGRPGADVRAIVHAPLAVISLKSSSRIPATFHGAFVGRQVKVGAGAVLGTVGTCGDGVKQTPDELCDVPEDAACPGLCQSDCTCATPTGQQAILHAVGPTVLHNATSFGLQIFGESFAPGAVLQLSDKATGAIVATLPTSFASSTEMTSLLPAGLPVPTGIQRELVARVLNPGALASSPPSIGHCQEDGPGSPTACTSDLDCPPGAGSCVTGDQRLTLFNDLAFLNPNSAAVVPAPFGVCDNGTPCQSAAACSGIGSGACAAKLYVTPQQRDELWVFNTGTRQFVDRNSLQSGIQGIPVGDNPFHVEMLASGGPVRAWVVNRFDDSFSIVDPATDTELARVTGAALGVPGRLRMETEVEFNRAGTRAYLSNENLDEVQVLDIAGPRRDAPVLIGAIDVGVNPRGMATNAADTILYVANVQSADLSVVDIAPGSATENQVIATVAPRATDDIVGGRADGWEPFVIGGRAPRGIVYSDALDAVFLTSIGPQTGPRQGVVQTGGAIINPTITVIDGATNTITAHVAFDIFNRNLPSCTDPELMALDDARGRLYVTCQGSGTVSVLDAAALAAGVPAELAVIVLPSPGGVPTPTLALPPTVGTFGAKVCAAFTSSPGVACSVDANCSGCPSLVEGLPVVCCSTNNPIGLHNGPRGIALADDGDTLWVVNQFTTSIAELDVSPPNAALITVPSTVSFSGAFGVNTPQRDRRLGQIEFFTDVKKTGVSCATCHIDDHQDGVFFEADVRGPRLRRVLSVRGTRDFTPLLQDQLVPDLLSFTDIVVQAERGGPIPCIPCIEINGSPFCFGGGSCTVTSDSENQQNALYTKAITFFPNPNLNTDGSFSTSVPLPGGGTGDAVRGAVVFDELACQSCHPEPMFTIDQLRAFDSSTLGAPVRMRETDTPVFIPLRSQCQDVNRPPGSDGSAGFSVPTLRGVWDTFPLLVSGSAGLGAVGVDPVFAPGCTPGSAGCCSQLQSPLNPSGTPVPEQHLAVTAKDAMRAVLTAPLAVPGTGHGAALGLSASDLDALIAYLRSL